MHKLHKTVHVISLGVLLASATAFGVAEPPTYRVNSLDEIAGRTGTGGVAAETGAIYVDIGDLGNRDEMMAKGLFKHGGVAMHPGDAGMIAIADRILAAIVEHLETSD